MFISLKHLLSGLLAGVMMALPCAAEDFFRLSDFGDVSTPTGATKAMAQAQKQIVAKGGGTILIDAKVHPGFEAESFVQQRLNATAITVVDIRKGGYRLTMPSLGFRRSMDPNGYSALSIDREINQPTKNIQGKNTMVRLSDRVISGTASYNQPIKDFELCADKELMKVFPPAIKGLAVGNELQVRMGAESTKYSERSFSSTIIAKIDSIGWDVENRRPYIILRKLNSKDKWGKVLNLFNKSSVSSLYIKEVTHCDLENSGTVSMTKRNYGQGDSFGFSVRYEYVGNVMSTGGDECGTAFTTDIWHMLETFIGRVEKYDPQKNELIYTPDSDAAPTLGTSRPLINLNPKKWLTEGHIVIEGLPGDRHNGVNPKAYVKGVNTRWTPDIIGRYLAVDVPDEYAGNPERGYWKGALRGRKVRRWWYISKFEQLSSGEQRLWVRRIRWSVFDNAVPVLINEDNYRRELAYIIAPGAMVSDVSRAVPIENKHAVKERYIKARANEPRTIVLAASPDSTGKFAFQPGDMVEQAVGADPAHPVGFRVRHREAMPSNNGKSASFESTNNGAYPIWAALAVSGGHDRMQIPSHSKYFNVIDVNATCDYGIRFRREVKHAALMLDHASQRITWKTAKGNVTLNAGNDGSLKLDANGGITSVSGISAGDIGGKNLRGIDCKIEAGAKEVFIKFIRPEPDNNYSLTAQPNWICRWAVTEKHEDGFKIRFDAPASGNASIDWQLLR
jgi:hypothetical protein